MTPGPLVIIRGDRFIEQPNAAIHRFRADIARAIKNSRIDPDTHDTVWALAITANDWPDLPPWVQQLLRQQ